MGTNGIESITVIGTGMIGAHVALFMAMKGYNPTMYGRTEQSLERGRKRIRGSLEELIDANVYGQSEADAIGKRIRTTTSVEQAVTGSDLVVEAVAEDLELKQSFFEQFDAAAPRSALLASSTSGLSPNDLGKGVKYKERVMVAHFWNPPHLVPLVELVAHDNATEDNINALIEFLERIGKKPVLLKKDVPGHIGNRLQHAMFREAMELLEQGVAEPADVDRVVMYGFGPRYSRIGPIEYVDSVGLDLQLAVEGYLFRSLSNAREPQSVLTEKYEKKQWGMKTGSGFYDWEQRDAAEMLLRKNMEYIRRLNES
jgi:3-hydroxybutyryl-CoA dehydrogenase